jgi:cell division septation protein DedD
MLGARACAALLSLAWLLASSASEGQAGPRRLLEGLEIGREGTAARLRVRFSVPVRYLRHAPSRRGSVIQVRVDPLALPGAAAVLPSEVLHAPPGAGLPLVEVGYAADGVAGRILEVRFSREVSFEVAQRDLRSVVVTVVAEAPSRAAASAPATPAPSPAASEATLAEATSGAPPTPALLDRAPEGGWAVQIHAAPSSEPPPPIPPRGLPARGRLYTVPLVRNGVSWTRLRFGFFATRAEAEAARRELVATFPGAWVVEAPANERELADEVAAPARIAVAVEPSGDPDTGAAQAGSGDRVAFLVEEGRAALAAGDLDRAVALFTQAGTLPEHERTPEALELLGLARERKGQAAHARAEYERYLERHPEGEGAERVRQRLDALLTATTSPRERLREASGDRAARPDVYGSVATFYRRSARLPKGAGEETDFSSQLSDLSLGVRGRAGDYDLRGEAAGSYRWNLLDEEPEWDSGVEEGRVRSLFLDFADRDGPLSGRLGRQWSSSGGVLGTFDGGRLGVRFAGPWKVSAVAGFPVETFLENSPDTSRHFHGLSFGVEGFRERLDAELFGIRQIADGETDRVGVGGEFRTFWEGAFLAGLVDYDVHFQDLTTAHLLGDWEVVADTHLNLLLDYRRSPIPATSNALLGQPVDSLDDLGLSGDEIRELAEDRSARTQLATLGATRRLSDRFQLAGDVSVSEYGETGSSDAIAGFEGTGLVYAYSTQLVASQLLGESDVQTLGLRYVESRELDAIALLLHGYYPLTRALRLKPLLVLVRRRPSGEAGLFTARPGLGFDYRFWRFTVDAGGSVEWSDRESVEGAADDRRYTLEAGIRYDF